MGHLFRTSSTLLLFFSLTACESASNLPDASTPTPNDVAQSKTCTATSALVRLSTSDGVELSADFDVPSAPPRGAVVLLHMIPPSNDRSNYPLAFREALLENDLIVLNVDRRGAGESTGVALEAYEGSKGVLDAEAAAAYLIDSGCVDANAIAFVGASNGTTTVFDYVVKSAVAPKAIVFLSAGSYTENQNSMAQHRSKLSMPTLIMWDAAESGVDQWAQAQRGDAPDSWTFDERSPGGHGTNMFQSAPQSLQSVSDFISAAFN